MAASAQHPLAEEILRAPTLYALLPVAERAAAAELLGMSLEALAEKGGLSPASAAALQDILRKGRVKTVRDLIAGAHPTMPRWKAPRGAATEFLSALKALFLDALEAPLPTWQSRAELLAWAQAEGIADALTAPLHRLGLKTATIQRLRLTRADSCALIDAIVPDDYGGARIHAALGAAGRAEVAQEATRYLTELAAALRQTRKVAEQARASWPPPGASAGLAATGEVLLAEFEKRREQAQRDLPLELVEEVRADVTADPPAIRVSMRAPRARAGTQLEAVRIRLALDSPSSTCDCTVARTGSCFHIPAAILLILRTLRDPAHPLTRDVGKAVETPAWMRTLQALDAALVEPGADEAKERVAWRLTVGQSGAVGVQPILQKRLAKGGWSKGTRLDRWDARNACVSERDRRIWAALSGDSYYSEPPGAAIARALVELCGHDLVYLADSASQPVAVVESPVALRSVERDGGYEVVVMAGEVEVRPADLVAALDAQGRCGIAAVIDRSVCRVVRPSPRLETVLRALGGRSTFFPAEAVGPLLERVQGLQQIVPVELPKALAGREVEPENHVVLRLEREGADGLLLTTLVRPLAGGAAFEPGVGPALAAAVVEEERICARREPEAERAAATAALRSLPLPHPIDEDEADFQLRLAGDAALDLLVHLAERAPAPGFTIEWPKQRQRITRPARAADVRAEVKQQRDWFGLAGGVDVDGVSVDLALALDAARRGSRYVEAEPGVFVALADELKEKLARAAEQVHEGREGLELSFAAAPAIEALVEDGAELRAIRAFGDLLGRIRASRDYQAPLPEGLRAELRPYQVEGFRWLARLAEWGAGGCLADDMGLGKTLQSIALLLHRAAQGPALVVAPTSVCGNWLREVERFAPGLRAIRYGALSDPERDALELGPGDLLVVSYGLLARDGERLATRHFATAIFDEAQALKNPQTDRAQAARQIDAAIRIALSGTPMENHLGELWSLYRIVVPGLLGSADRFRERFALPIERGDAGRRRALSSVLRPFLLRRTKAEVATDLPPRSEIDVAVDLSPAERRLYDEARLAAAARVAGLDGSLPPEQRRFEILAAITRLRLCACHPRLYDETSQLPSSKLATLVSTLEELREEGHRALVFSQFTKHLDLVEEALAKAGIRTLRLDGKTAAASRQDRVDRWQAGEGDAFLVSLKAGGTGLNLTAADYVVHLDPWWNPAAEDQATDRAHRIGQTRPVTVLRLVSRGTIEEQILALHGEKRALLSGVLDGADGGVRVDAAALVALLEAPVDVDPVEDDAVDRDAEEPAAAAGPIVPDCLRTADPQRLVDDLRRFLEHKHDAGGIGPGPVRSYPRAISRFAQFLAAGHAAPLADAPLERVRDHYLDALRTGTWPAPGSEPQVARSAFGQLEAMLRAARA
ncbi:SNF2-related protein [Vulgatibacter sp.]|uniref:SNF2-related protein n=1 Tax=Vulgatibacter sp. TaxID=1971226 RepID=UPI003565693B